jgi:hypothetical protein
MAINGTRTTALTTASKLVARRGRAVFEQHRL